MLFLQKCLYLKSYIKYLTNYDDQKIIRYTAPRFRKTPK